jgi:hypothetical protein
MGVAVTQQFNTTTSMGRLTLNILLSFAQFEREVTGERIRDKIAASKRKGMWMGGVTPLGYEVRDRKLVIVPEEAATVRLIYARYQELGSVRLLQQHLDTAGIRSKVRPGGRRPSLLPGRSLCPPLQSHLHRRDRPQGRAPCGVAGADPRTAPLGDGPAPADTEGVRTTYGSRLYANHIPSRDDLQVAAARKNGAIVLGKTNTPEFGSGGTNR